MAQSCKPLVRDIASKLRGNLPKRARSKLYIVISLAFPHPTTVYMCSNEGVSLMCSRAWGSWAFLVCQQTGNAQHTW